MFPKIFYHFCKNLLSVELTFLPQMPLFFNKAIRSCIFSSILLLLAFCTSAQVSNINSLKKQIAATQSDTTRSRLYRQLGMEYESFSFDSSYLFYENSLKFAQKSNQKKYISQSMYYLARANLYITKDESKATELANKAIILAKEINEYVTLSGCYQVLGIVSYHQNTGNDIDFLNKGVFYAQLAHNDNFLGDAYSTICQVHHLRKNYNEALRNLKKSLDVRKRVSIDEWFTNAIDYCDILEKQNKFDESYQFAQTIVPQRKNLQKKHGEYVYMNDNGRLEMKLRNYKNAEEWFLKAVNFEKQRAKPDTNHLAYTFTELEALYKQTGNYQKAHEALKELFSIRLWLVQKRNSQDSKLQITKQKEALDLEKKEIEISLLSQQKKQQTIFLTVTIIVALVLVSLLVILQRNKQRIEQQKTELTQLNKTKDKLFSIIAHDLREPMASFKGLLQLIEEEALSQQEFRELSKSLKQNVDNIHAMLENLLLWSLSQMNGIKPNFRKLYISDSLNETVSFFRNVAKQKHIELKTDITENLIALADENQMQTVFRNLLNNAIKFTPQSGVVKIIGEQNESQILLKVIDSGKGMTQDELNNLFTKPKLNRGTAGEKGTGLGLILCKELIEQNKGEISVSSAVGQGTSFEIRLQKG